MELNCIKLQFYLSPTKLSCLAPRLPLSAYGIRTSTRSLVMTAFSENLLRAAVSA